MRASRDEAFLDAWAEVVRAQPTVAYAPPHGEEWPECVGCSERRADVRIARAGNDGGGGRGCFCTPTFCVECLGKWWLSQAERAHDGAATRDDEIGRILGRSGTCPTCRTKFRVTDCSTLEGATPGGNAAR